MTSLKLNGGYTIRATANSLAVSLVRCSVGILKWTKHELKVMVRKARKIIIMNGM